MLIPFLFPTLIVIRTGLLERFCISRSVDFYKVPPLPFLPFRFTSGNMFWNYLHVNRFTTTIYLLASVTVYSPVFEREILVGQGSFASSLKCRCTSDYCSPFMQDTVVVYIRVSSNVIRYIRSLGGASYSALPPPLLVVIRLVFLCPVELSPVRPRRWPPAAARDSHSVFS